MSTFLIITLSILGYLAIGTVTGLVVAALDERERARNAVGVFRKDNKPDVFADTVGGALAGGVFLWPIVLMVAILWSGQKVGERIVCRLARVHNIPEVRNANIQKLEQMCCIKD